MRARVLFPCLWILICAWLAQAESVSVAELGRRIAGLQSESDKTAARALGHLQLDERLSSNQLATLLPGLPGERSRIALLGIADESIFLDPPRSEFVMLVAPSVVEQGKILSRAYDFVLKTMPKLPDFIALQELTRIESTLPRREISQDRPDATPFRKVDGSVTELAYSNGAEVLQSGKRQAGRQTKGLAAYGVFGPLLQSTMTDILRGKVAWSYWQTTATGRAAVFRYRVESAPQFKVGFCCVDGKVVESTPPYHGEITIDPDTGRVFRIVIQTEPGCYPIARADVAVEYGPVSIGGTEYLCPLRSVALAARPVTDEPPALPHSRIMVAAEITSINHMEYRDYKVFRTEMRILPPFQPVTQPHKR